MYILYIHLHRESKLMFKLYCADTETILPVQIQKQFYLYKKLSKSFTVLRKKLNKISPVGLVQYTYEQCYLIANFHSFVKLIEFKI